jgi:trk system potassium uptake protein TrkH
MRKGLFMGILGRFLQIYAVLTFLPAILTLVYPEKAINFYLFTGTSLLALVSGTLMHRFGSTGDPSVQEAIILTLLGWASAILLGSIPLLEYLPVADAVFEAASGRRIFHTLYFSGEASCSG